MVIAMSNDQSLHFEETTREAQVEHMCRLIGTEFARVHTTTPEGAKNILTAECQKWLSETAKEVEENIAVSIMQSPVPTTQSDLVELESFVKEFADTVLETRKAARNEHGFSTAITVDAKCFLDAKKRLKERMDWLYLLK